MSFDSLTIIYLIIWINLVFHIIRIFENYSALLKPIIDSELSYGYFKIVMTIKPEINYIKLESHECHSIQKNSGKTLLIKY